ncbi:MAG: amidohydrolase [Solirubrobacteraceae bacterium]|jgi:hypothetical protein
MRVDVHQHIWTAPLLEALAVRDSLPYVRRVAGGSVLHSAGERPYAIDAGAQAPRYRAGLVASDGLDLALIALSSPVGIEALSRVEATRLIAAHLDGVRSLGEAFAAWGPVALDRPDPDDVDELLARRCVGISLPAGALAQADGPAAAIGPVLARVARRGVPLFVHPGPGTDTPRGGEASTAEPPWWLALTGYVAQMQAAWLTFVTRCRREHPQLVALFAMLAGCAPLLSERLAARGGPAIELGDRRVFYDCSSYGPAAVDAVARLVGPEQLVFGSDRPVIEPIRCGDDRRLQANAARLLADRASTR